MRRALLTSLLLSYTLVPAVASTPTVTGALALDHVRIIETDRGRVTPIRCVRVEDKRIALVAKARSKACLRSARVIDLKGRYLMPGLIDMHAHLTLGPLEVTREHGRAVMQARADDAIAEHNANRLVAFGVTTLRNPGGDLPAAARYKARWAAGERVGPEAFNAGPVINNADLPGLAIGVRTPEDMERVIGAQVQAGADWIKLYTGLSPTLLKAGIDAAHRHKRPAVAHLDRIAWTDALAMGLDGIVHLMPLSPDLLAPEQRSAWPAQARPGTYAFFEWWEHFDPDGPQADRLVGAFQRYRPVFDATLVAFHAAFVQDQSNPYQDDARRYAHARLFANWNDGFTFAIGWKPEDFHRARAVWPKVQRMAVRLYATDARMTLGTDMSNPWIAPGISLHREMQLLAEAGVPVPRILRAATSNAADALGAGTRLGRVAPGFEADLLVLDANPLHDVQHTRDIHAVVLDGQFLDSITLNRLKGE